MEAIKTAMTTLPRGYPWTAPAIAEPVAPSREIRRVTRKELPDGRMLEFVFELQTHATETMSFSTWELTHAPKLDCPCTPADVDDVTACSACFRLVCVRRHSATCSLCGQVFGSCCLNPERVFGRIVCKECAFQATATPFRKVARWLFRHAVGVFCSGCKEGQR